jgi:hypothetical protein
MERPGDDFKATHNITIAERDTTFGGQISRLQVAEVIGTAIARTGLAENKVGCHTCHIQQSSTVMRVHAAPAGCVRTVEPLMNKQEVQTKRADC